MAAASLKPCHAHRPARAHAANCGCGPVPLTSMFGQHSIIVSMRADPNPVSRIAANIGECAVIDINSYTPKSADFLEVQRGMKRVALPESVGLARAFLHVRRKGPVCCPKPRVGSALHQSVEPAPSRYPRPIPAPRNRALPPPSLLPFAGPKHPNVSPAADRKAPKIPSATVFRWPLRFPARCSRGIRCFNAAGLSSAEKGAALARARRTLCGKRDSPNPTHASTRPRSCERGKALNFTIVWAVAVQSYRTRRMGPLVKC